MRQIKISKLPDLSHVYQSPGQVLRVAIVHLEVMLAEADSPTPHSIAKFRRDLPYAVYDTKLAGTQILVNRQYDAVGSNGVRRVAMRWEGYPNLHVRLTQSQIDRVCEPGERILFYRGLAPWGGLMEAEGYLDRLRCLSDMVASATRCPCGAIAPFLGQRQLQT